MQLPGHLPELPYHFYSLLYLQDASLIILHPEGLTGYLENHSLTLIMSKTTLIMQMLIGGEKPATLKSQL